MSLLQYGARDLGFSFLGSGGELTKAVIVDQKFKEQKPENDPANSGTTHAAAGCRDTAGDRPFAFEMPTPTYPRPGSQLPGAGTQPVIDRFAKTPTRPTPGHDRPSIKTKIQPVYNCCSQEQADMVDTVVQLPV